MAFPLFLLILYIIFIKFEGIYLVSNETQYKFIEASSNSVLQKYLPIWANGMIRIEKDGSRLL